MRAFLLAILEFGPIAAFFFSTKLGDIFIATGVFMVCSILGLIFKYILTKRISYFLIFSSIVLFIMGSLTLVFKNSNFIKMKPTIFYSLCGISCYVGAINNKIFLKNMLLDINMKEQNWLILSKRVSIFCIFLAVLNETIWRFLGENAWINFKFFITPFILGTFIIFQKRFIDKHSDTNKQGKKNGLV